VSRGYFGIGVEGISKSYNLGAVMRTAHAFDASFTFTVDAALDLYKAQATDTSRSHTLQHNRQNPYKILFKCQLSCRFDPL